MNGEERKSKLKYLSETRLLQPSGKGAVFCFFNWEGKMLFPMQDAKLKEAVRGEVVRAAKEECRLNWFASVAIPINIWIAYVEMPAKSDDLQQHQLNMIKY
ncbi:hypothetical protein HNO89_001541 [Sporosarcina luteola]|nr:hypothetical protein [Sporosarcina luteola]